MSWIVLEASGQKITLDPQTLHDIKEAVERQLSDLTFTEGIEIARALGLSLADLPVLFALLFANKKAAR